jgi:ribonucleoside-diphosphate reductase alpha chain
MIELKTKEDLLGYANKKVVQAGIESKKNMEEAKKMLEKENPDFNNVISAKVWIEKRKYKDETVDEHYQRIADGLFDKNDKTDPILKSYSVKESIEEINETFFQLLRNHKIILGGRSSFALGTDRKSVTYSNCFVLPNVPDNLRDIYKTLSDSAWTMKHGGGVGYYFGALRPNGSAITNSGGHSSGVCSHMEVFNTMCSTISGGGGRRGAQIAVLPIWHPDIIEYILYKKGYTSGKLMNFNISVGILDDFMMKVKNEEEYELVFPNFEDEDIKTIYNKPWNRPFVSGFIIALRHFLATRPPELSLSLVLKER